MPHVIVAGGGLAGLAATAALADAGFEVDLYESKPYLGGRAASYTIPFGDGSTAIIDNCQHILLRCCTNLLDLYRRLGVEHRITFHREFYFIEPGGRTSVFGPGRLPYPFHFAEAFAGLKFLKPLEKIALARGMISLMRDAGRSDLDELTMAEWLERQGQPPSVVARFWRQVLVSAVNVELHQMAACHGFQVFRTGFLGGPASFEMGVPDVPLSMLVSYWETRPNVRIHLRTSVERIEAGCARVDGSSIPFEDCVVALPWHQVEKVLPGFAPPVIEASPITGVHLWFDRAITHLPHATLLDRTMQWMFNKGGGRQISLVVSASSSLDRMQKKDVADLAIQELAEFFPEVRRAQLLRFHVAKEMSATIRAVPGLNSIRPGPVTTVPQVVVAGDWTNTGWPSTMEGAVRSGYRAAEEVLRRNGRVARFVLD